MTDALKAACQRLEAYVAEAFLRREDLDVVKLHRLELEIASAAKVHEKGLPF